MTLLSRSEEQFISLGCQEDCRIDGRTCLETRNHVIVTEKGYISSLPADSSLAPDASSSQNGGEPPLILSNGSARLTTLDMEETILCSVKAQIVRPSIMRPDRGVIEIAVDKLSAGSPSELDEIQALLSHLLLQDDSVLVDRKALCILPREYVWKLSIDVMFLTAAATATSRLYAVASVIQAALESTLLPNISTQDNSNPNNTNTSSGNNQNQQQQYSLVVQDDIQLAQPILPANGPRVTIVSVALIPCSSSSAHQQSSVVMIVDATSQEQACAVGQVHVTIQQPGRVSKSKSSDGDNQIRICAVQATGKILVASLPEIMDFSLQVVLRDSKRPREYRQTTTGHASLLQEPFGLQ